MIPIPSNRRDEKIIIQGIVETNRLPGNEHKQYSQFAICLSSSEVNKQVTDARNPEVLYGRTLTTFASTSEGIKTSSLTQDV